MQKIKKIHSKTYSAIEGIKYKLIGYQPVGVLYNIPREEIAEWKDGYWYQLGCGKKIRNFVIEKVIEL